MVRDGALSFVQLDHVSKVFAGTTAVNDVSLDVKKFDTSMPVVEAI
jgi:ABC-type branched-subunit amino acid transport system ATPase component